VNSGVDRDWYGWASDRLCDLGSRQSMSRNGRWPPSFSVSTVNCILLRSPMSVAEILLVFLDHGVR
jgi:hypothetical protein